jgi:hypothetical protein
MADHTVPTPTPTPQQATCRLCGASFVPPRPTTDVCRWCWYGGAVHAAERPALLAALRALPGVESADMEHTGGGCFALRVRLTGGRACLATDAFLMDGEWTTDAAIPAVGEPWMLCEYREDDDCDEPVGGEYAPLTDADLIDVVRRLARPEVTRG